MKRQNKAPRPADDLVLDGYVKHPPEIWWVDDPPPSLIVSELELASRGVQPVLSLWVLRREYDEGDALAPLEAFLVAHEHGLFPPMWCLDALAAGFLRYHQAQGKDRLDTSLGLTRTRGKDCFRESTIRGVNRWLARQMYYLRTMRRPTNVISQ